MIPKNSTQVSLVPQIKEPMKSSFSVAITYCSVLIFTTPILSAANDPIKQIDLQIADGQGGSFLPDNQEENPGAFTVANKNNTDGDTTPDSGDNDVPGEIDLMQIRLNQFTPYDAAKDADKTVSLTVPGNAKLYKSSDKKSGEETNRSWKAKDLPKTFWVEMQNASSSVRSDVFTLTGGGATDTVKATGIWVERRQVAQNTATWQQVVAADATWMDMPNPPRNWFLGGVGIRPISTSVTNVLMVQFEVFPDKVGAEAKVKFDPTRQRQGKVWGNGQVTTDIPSFPSRDLPNDDPWDSDESQIPTEKNYLYTHDGPGVNTQVASYDTRVMIVNFNEYVRVRVDGIVPTGNATVGSRCSGKVEWHVMHDLFKNSSGNWERNVNGNGVHVGHVTVP